MSDASVHFGHGVDGAERATECHSRLFGWTFHERVGGESLGAAGCRHRV